MAEQTELQEFSMRGPFGGIQSQLSPDDIEDVGFLDCVNVVFRDGKAYIRPGYTNLPAMPTSQENAVGISDFFNSAATRTQVVITPTRLLLWNGVGFTNITGPGLTGGASQLFSTAVVNYKLCFSQGTDKVMLYDGIAGTYAVASANAVAARFLMEFGTHLILGSTVEAGVSYPQRVRWTGAGDPTDYTSFNAGVSDQINDLGPINSLAKLYQTGYLMQQRGITQVIQTGNGLAPFAFVPMSSRAHGCVCPYSSSVYGETLVFYVGQDNVYMFDGTASHPIGDQPMQGSRKRLGARTRILADLSLVSFQTVTGLVTTGVNGNDFNAYLLNIPNVAVWVYNIDEGNWTRWTYGAQQILTIQPFFVGSATRIIDLIGTIAQQSWYLNTLTETKTFDSLAFSFAGGASASIGNTDFTNYSEQPWNITSGQHRFKDDRHQKTVKKFRISMLDLGSTVFEVAVTGYLNVPNTAYFVSQSQSQVIVMGNGSGVVIKKILDFSVPGDYIQWTLFGTTALPYCVVELGIFYDIGGENRNW